MRFLHSIALILFSAFPVWGNGFASPDTTQAHQAWEKAEKSWDKVEYSTALRQYRLALTGFLSAKQWERASNALQNAALSATRIRKANPIDSAISEYTLALTKAGKMTPAHQANVEMARIEYWFCKRRLDSAEVCVRKAIRLRETALGKFHAKTGVSYNSLGIILDHLERGQEALAAFQHVYKVALKNYTPPHEKIRSAINNIGNAYSTLQDFKAAKQCYHQSLDMAIGLHGAKSMKTETSLNNLAHVSNEIRDYDSCIYFRNKLREILVANLGENHLETLMNESRIADQYVHKGHYDEAISRFEKLVDRLQTFPKSEYKDIHYQYGQLADCYLGKEEYDKAELYYRKALSESLANLDPKWAIHGVSHYGIAQCQQGRDEYEPALGSLKKCLAYQLPELGETSGNIAMIYYEIGSTYNQLGSPDSSVIYYQKAVSIYEKETALEYLNSWANALVALGKLADKRKDYAKALELKQKGVAIMNRAYPGIHHSKAYPWAQLAKTYELQGNNEAALRCIWRAMYENGPGNVDTLSLKTSSFRMAPLNLDNYCLHLYQASKLMVKISKPGHEADVLTFLYWADEALMHLQNQRSLESDQITLGHEIQLVSGLALFVLNQLQKKRPDFRFNEQTADDWIFYFASRRQASALLQSKATNKAKALSGIPKEVIAKENTLQSQIRLLEKNLQELGQPETKADSVKKEVQTQKRFELQRERTLLTQKTEQNFPRYKALRNVSAFPSLVDVQALLHSAKKRTALISIIWDEEHPFLYLISPAGQHLFSYPPDTVAGKKIRALRNAIRLGNSLLVNEYGRNIYQTYFRAVDLALQKEKIEKLVFVAEGPWSTFPFESLVFMDKGQSRFWLEKYEFATTQSIPLWVKNQKEGSGAVAKESNTLKCLAFAPVFADKEPNFLNATCERFVKAYTRSLDSDGQANKLAQKTRAFGKDGMYINPLPYTENEVLRISSLFGRDKNLFFKYFMRKDAVESKFKSEEAANADILHLATHGFVNEDKPELSGLLFHPTPTDSTEDGILYTGEIYNLNLKADLVTLSACETGLGKVRSGEGMLGLTRSFTYAGAKNLLVSLWKVSDKATSDLMIELYNQMLSGKSKSESLRWAKLKLMKNKATANPYYWAAFVLVEG